MDPNRPTQFAYLTKAFAGDYSSEAIHVNGLCPGTVETEMVRNVIKQSADPEATRQAMVDRRLTPWLGTVDEIARAMLYLANPANSFTTGAILAVDGGATVK